MPPHQTPPSHYPTIIPWSHKCQGCPPPPCTNIANPNVGATKVEERWVGKKDYANWTCSTQQRLKVHVKQVRSLTCPNIHLWTPLEIPCIAMVPMQNPITHFRSSTLGSSILDDWCPKSCLDCHPKMHDNAKNSQEHVRLPEVGQPYWPQPKVVGHHVEQQKNVILDPTCCPLGMWVTWKWANMWSTSSGTRLVHSHRKWWTHELTIITSTCIGSLIQALNCCYATNIVGREPSQRWDIL